MAIFNCYVSSPEGMWSWCGLIFLDSFNFWIFMAASRRQMFHEWKATSVVIKFSGSFYELPTFSGLEWYGEKITYIIYLLGWTWNLSFFRIEGESNGRADPVPHGPRLVQEGRRVLELTGAPGRAKVHGGSVHFFSLISGFSGEWNCNSYIIHIHPYIYIYIHVYTYSSSRILGYQLFIFRTIHQMRIVAPKLNFWVPGHLLPKTSKLAAG